MYWVEWKTRLGRARRRTVSSARGPTPVSAGIPVRARRRSSTSDSWGTLVREGRADRPRRGRPQHAKRRCLAASSVETMRQTSSSSARVVDVRDRPARLVGSASLGDRCTATPIVLIAEPRVILG